MDTYTYFPSGVKAIPDGCIPTVIVLIIVLLVVLIILIVVPYGAKLLLPKFVTYARRPFGDIAIANGPETPGIVVDTVLVLVSITPIVPVPVLPSI